MTMIEIFSPVGRPVEQARTRLIPLPDLRGAAIAVLENTKPNARAVLTGMAHRVAEAAGANEVIVERKESAAQGAPPEVIRRLSGAAQLVFAGSAD